MSYLLKLSALSRKWHFSNLGESFKEEISFNLSNWMLTGKKGLLTMFAQKVVQSSPNDASPKRRQNKAQHYNCYCYCHCYCYCSVYCRRDKITGLWVLFISTPKKGFNFIFNGYEICSTPQKWKWKPQKLFNE